MPTNAKTDILETIYVDLDALLDTRIGTISLIDNSAVSKILSSNTYHSRDMDIFEGIDNDTFKDKYKNRDKNTLVNSMLTNMVPLLGELVNKMLSQAINRPYHDGARIVINYYPYDLNNDEIEEICKAISVWLKECAPVSMISMSPKNLTPRFCKNNYSLMIKYDYEEWLDINANEFKNAQIPDITMLVPALYFNNKPSDEELAKITKKTMHPMKAIEFLASPLIGLELIDVAYFSIINKPLT